jgi:dihydrofolate reductase
MIKAILACDDVGGVSREARLPWPHNSIDLQWFKQHTAGQVVVMGSTTWQAPDMPKPLPKRTNVVITSQPELHPGADAYINGDLCSQIKELSENTDATVWLIGGPHVIDQTLGIIDEFYISRIPGEYDCDTFLPLRKIQMLFDRTYTQNETGVRFEIWSKKL